MKKALVYLIICWLGSIGTYGVRPLGTSEGIRYEMWEPHDTIPSQLLNPAREMYFASYDPRLHEGVSLEQMRIADKGFPSYEDFIADMLKRDFASYEAPAFRWIFFAYQEREIVGFASLLQQPQSFYIDHFGVSSAAKGKKIGTRLMGHIFNHLSSFWREGLPHEVTLDTRVFNVPAQAFYDKMHFKGVNPHPDPAKEGAYLHYRRPF